MRRPLLCCLLFLASLCPAGPSLAAGRVALVAGMSDYATSPLLNPVNDARAMAETLRKLGFEVELLENSDKREMLDALDRFACRLDQAEAGLFYFAGHGMQVAGVNYLIPTRINIRSEADVEFEALAADRVLARMEETACPVNILVLDACRDNPFARSFRSSSRGLAPMYAAKGAFIAYAAAPGQAASDGEGEHGVYTEHLLRHLETPGLSINDVFMQTRAGVMAATADAQVPWDASSLTSHFYFAGNQDAGVASAIPAGDSMESGTGKASTTVELGTTTSASTQRPATIAQRKEDARDSAQSTMSSTVQSATLKAGPAVRPLPTVPDQAEAQGAKGELRHFFELYEHFWTDYAKKGIADAYAEDARIVFPDFRQAPTLQSKAEFVGTLDERMELYQRAGWRLRNLEFLSVHVDGDRAMVRVATATGAKRQVQRGIVSYAMIREAGRWRIARQAIEEGPAKDPKPRDKAKQ